ncbi:MAG: hypothetical protein WC729_30020 [Sphingomonas sp.]|jgi:hypothetical protein|uniref:hypothetical protein n=1 Tax=Sphingomonas sp. TaxID=28214 RepID=UPI003564FADF
MAKKARKRPAKAKATSRKRRVSRKTRRTPAISLRKRGVTVYRSNPRRRVRRRVRRNPAFGRGIMGSLMTAVKDGAWVLGGVAGTNFIARQIPFGNGTVPVGAAKKLAVGVVLSMIVGKAVGRAAGEKVLTGAVVAVGTDLLRNMPMIGTALAGDNDLAFIRRTMGAYPTALTAGMGAYVEPYTGVRSEPNSR